MDLSDSENPKRQSLVDLDVLRIFYVNMICICIYIYIIHIYYREREREIVQ